MNAAVLERVRTQLAQRIRRREQFVNKRAHYTSLVEKQGDNSAGKRDKFTQLIAGAEATIKQIDRDIHKMTDMISRLEA
jgi:transcription elongation factor